MVASRLFMVKGTHRPGGIELAELRPEAGAAGRVAKRVLDVVLGAAMLVAVAPALVAAAAALRLTSPGPVLRRDWCCGPDGRTFSRLQLRRDRESALGRLLALGGCHELPELVNVLRGDMSLVGPRPRAPEALIASRPSFPGLVGHRPVRAGIAGWAQLAAVRRDATADEQRELDEWYVRSGSLRVDIEVLAATLATLWRRR